MPPDFPEQLQVRELHWADRPQELAVPTIDSHSVHLWLASPQKPNSWLTVFSPLLSSDENDRAMRFHFECDREDFVFARGMLRTVLAGYLKTNPRQLRFAYSEHGKPFLADPETDLRFNLSHTEGAVLLGVCRGRAIGVDIERMKEDFDPREISTRFFSEAEQRALTSLPEADQRSAFFRCWTRKEALLKARGHGLSFPLELFDVSIEATDITVSLTTRPDPAEARRWRILAAKAPEWCAAAIAIECLPRQSETA